MKMGHFNVLLWLMFGFGILSSIMTASTISLDPSKPASNATCTFKNQTGRCVHYTLCDNKHNFLEGGNLIENDLRSKRQCLRDEWCCILNTTNPVEATEKPILPKNVDKECLTTNMDSCPWCVGLYKTKGVKPGNSGLFCGGILVGPNAVLTTATCMKAAKNHQIIHAKVPGSQDPEKMYLVRSRAEHEQYNTGSHEYDVAVFMLETDVVWNNGRKNNGACLNIKWPLDDACYAFGFNYNDEIESTILQTKKGSCTKGGQGADAACGSLLFEDDDCLVSPGLPVICMTDSNDFIVTGLVRSPCRNSKAQLGSIHPASDWLIKELSKNGVNVSQYTT
ncbi:complement factor I-like isoform X2 [Colias croceus]|uniref:complement factor I-like isoform X2 n=1 Tax=Colias crocea TaxID=72248 RepID=UPI001E27FAF3|nr:complement factor I-like isoform X2 [Colias croceus]